MDKREFGLIKSFQIDNGELDALSPQECFVLGYELAEIDQLLKSPVAFRKTIHACNRDRIGAACAEAGRPFGVTWMPGDVSEEWMVLDVDELTGEGE